MLSAKSNIELREAMSHALFWLVILSLNVYISLDQGFSFWNSVGFQLLFLPFKMMAAYLLVYYQIGRLLLYKKYLLFLLSLVLSTYLFSVAMHLVHEYVARPWLSGKASPFTLAQMLTDIEIMLTRYIIWVYRAGILLSVVTVLRYHFKSRQQIEKLKQEKLELELATLKTQTRPAFLVQTLRQLQHLAQSQPNKAPAIIEQLSEVLDHLLYRSQTAQIPLVDELQFLETYLQLEQLKLGNALQWHIPKADHTHMIQPLLILSVLEWPLQQLSPNDQLIIRARIFDSSLQIEWQSQAKWLLQSVPLSLNQQLAHTYAEQFAWNQINEHHLQLSIPLWTKTINA